MTTTQLFERQYSEVELIGSDNEGVEVIDLVPPSVEDETPIFVAPGWTETPAVYKEVMKNLFKYRRILLTVGHPRKGGEPLNETEHKVEELRKATNLLRVLEAKGIEKAEFIAHSEGAINTTIAASIAPEQFESIVYVNPAGMVGEAKLMEAVERFMANMTADFLRAKRDHSIREQFRIRQLEGLKYIMANPFRALKETLAITTTEIHHLLAELHYDGINLGILAAEDDVLFPEDKIKQYVKEDHIDAYRVIPGGHNELHYRPDHYSEAIMTMLDEISRK